MLGNGLSGYFTVIQVALSAWDLINPIPMTEFQTVISLKEHYSSDIGIGICMLLEHKTYLVPVGS